MDERGLVVIANVVGKPIALDMATKERHRLPFARVCVEVSGDFMLPASVDVRIRCCDFTISIIYEWKPKRFSHCHSFGHCNGQCQKVKWVTEKVQMDGLRSNERKSEVEVKNLVGPSSSREGSLEEGEVDCHTLSQVSS